MSKFISKQPELQPTPNAITILEKRYFRGEDQGFTGMCKRVAKAVASVENDTNYRKKMEEVFFNLLVTGLFMPNFTTMGKAGGCAASQAEALGRMVSLAWRSGVGAKQVIKQLSGISCHCPSGFGENKISSCADAVAKAIAAHMEELTGDEGFHSKKQSSHQGACPECGSALEHASGCAVCHSCGFSRC